jgi:hypothetical protein
MDNYASGQSIAQANAHTLEVAQQKANQNIASLNVAEQYDQLKNQMKSTQLEQKGLEMLKTAGSAGIFKAKISEASEALADPSYVNPFTRAKGSIKDAIISTRTAISEPKSFLSKITEPVVSELEEKSTEEVAKGIGKQLTAGVEGIGAIGQFAGDIYSEASGKYDKENVGEKVSTIANQVGSGIVGVGLATGDVPVALVGEAINLGSDVVKDISSLFENKKQSDEVAKQEEDAQHSLYKAPAVQQETVISQKAF